MRRPSASVTADIRGGLYDLAADALSHRGKSSTATQLAGELRVGRAAVAPAPSDANRIHERLFRLGERHAAEDDLRRRGRVPSWSATVATTNMIPSSTVRGGRVEPPHDSADLG